METVYRDDDHCILEGVMTGTEGSLTVQGNKGLGTGEKRMTRNDKETDAE